MAKSLTSKLCTSLRSSLSFAQKRYLNTSVLFHSFSQEPLNVHCRHPKQFNFNKYQELNDRLEGIPYHELLDIGVKTVQEDLSHQEKILTEVMNWTSKVFDYNVRNGKKIRGIAVLKAYCTYRYDMEDSSWCLWNSDDWKKAVILAWCVEILQAFFLISDDIMDQSVLRRGKPCWYKLPEVGLCAVNDGLMMLCGIYKLLEKHFKNFTCYNELVHQFLQVTEKTTYGQCLDMMCNPSNERPRFEFFNFKKYQTLAEMKTTYYTYCLPVHLGMHLAGGCSPSDFDVSKQLCMKIGVYFQSQDDFLDCFGNHEKTGKFGNDIREGKCTWFAAKFLEGASETQKNEFMENYGRDDQKCISTVLDLYKQSSLLEKFERYDEDLSSEICSIIESMDDVKGGLYYNLFSQLRKREK